MLSKPFYTPEPDRVAGLPDGRRHRRRHGRAVVHLLVHVVVDPEEEGFLEALHADRDLPRGST